MLECEKIQDILKLYEQAFGQQINRAKTTIFFSKNTSTVAQGEIKDNLGVPVIRQYEKFFPHDNIMEANDFARGSFAWRSILKARELITTRSSWRVGNRSSIKIKADKWLLEEGHRCILFLLPNVPPDATVDSLLTGNPPTWNEPKIRFIFLPYDADVILSIPLSERSPPNCIIWHEASDGKYSVRSGYCTLLKESWTSNRSSFSTRGRDTMWKQIRSKNTPPKVVQDPYCEGCGKEVEDCLHALWSCGVVKKIWEAIPDLLSFLPHQYGSFSDLARRLMENATPHLPEKFAVVAWFLWHKRKKSRPLLNPSLPSFRDGAPLLSTVLSRRLAAKQAITFALEVGIGHVFFEGDSEVIVRALCSLEAPPNVYGHIIDDV
uniref:Reverse transcriptase zinc-binding domain-containing protein n=1 Tax=Fagus sylvatica TaxID=28930 RepID=A0A2N9GKH9_FAGSY